MFDFHEQKCEVRGYTLRCNVRGRILASTVRDSHANEIQDWTLSQLLGTGDKTGERRIEAA
jgi:hypothetical protein